MKRLFALVLAVVLTVVMSVTAYAFTASDLDNEYKNVLKNFAEVINGNTVFNSFSFSDTSTSQDCKKYLEQCLTNTSRLLITMTTQCGNLNNPTLSFYFVPEDVILTKETLTTSNRHTLKYTFSKPITYLNIRGSSVELGTWSIPTGTSLTSQFSISYARTDPESTMGDSITKLFPIGYFTHSSEFSIDARYLMTDFEGSLVFRINDTIYEPDEPTPPVGPSQPDIGYPDFPKVEGEYIAYDTTIWNSFAFTVRDTIGKVSNIGFIVFGVITGASIIVNLTKKFIGDHDE